MYFGLLGWSLKNSFAEIKALFSGDAKTILKLIFFVY
jgi:hypothetical protein